MRTKKQPVFDKLSFALLARSFTSSYSLVASVIIITKDRSTYLDLTLASLERQNFPSKYWEVIVVNDASFDDTANIIELYKQRGRIQLKSIDFGSPQGGSIARNHAIEMAQGAVVLFLDDSHIALPDLLLQHLRHQAQTPSFVIGNSNICVHSHVFSPMGNALKGVSGARSLQPSDLDSISTCQEWTCDDGRGHQAIWTYFQQQRQPVPYIWTYFEGSNASIAHTLLTRQSAFREGHWNWDLGQWGLECYEFALRIHQAEYPIILVPSAVAWRQMRPPSTVDFQQRQTNIDFFFAHHPELERAMVEPLLWQ